MSANEILGLATSLIDELGMTGFLLACCVVVVVGLVIGLFINKS